MLAMPRAMTTEIKTPVHQLLIRLPQHAAMNERASNIKQNTGFQNADTIQAGKTVRPLKCRSPIVAIS